MTIFADVEVVSFVACDMSRHKDFPGHVAGDFSCSIINKCQMLHLTCVYICIHQI